MNYSLVALLYGMKFKKLLDIFLKPIENEYDLNKVDLGSVFPVDFIAIVFRRVMAGGDVYACRAA